MSNILISEANDWVEDTKLAPSFTTLDTGLESQVASEVLSSLRSSYDVSTWVDSPSTPLLVRRIIAMRYVAWVYDKVYSENEGLSDYAALLRSSANDLLNGITSGSVELPEVAPTGGSKGLPGYYPTDGSSALDPTPFDRSLGDAKFSMGMLF